jgi:hypothetical protein
MLGSTSVFCERSSDQQITKTYPITTDTPHQVAPRGIAPGSSGAMRGTTLSTVAPRPEPPEQFQQASRSTSACCVLIRLSCLITSRRGSGQADRGDQPYLQSHRQTFPAFWHILPSLPLAHLWGRKGLSISQSHTTVTLASYMHVSLAAAGGFLEYVYLPSPGPSSFLT